MAHFETAYTMKWIKHIFRPFWDYLPLLAEITFAPWWFLDRVLDLNDEEDDESDEEADKLRHYAFFWAAMYLIIQPYTLPSRLTGSESGGLVKSFEKEILLLVVIVAFSFVFLLTRKKNEEIKLDTFLNLIIPVMAPAIFLNVIVDALALVYLERLGLGRQAIFTQCKGLYDYRCVGGLLREQSGAPYAFSLTNSLLEGHFVALFGILYIFGLHRLRNKKQFPVDNEIARVACMIFLYLFSQFVSLHSNGILT